jgi:dihydrofolate reductase
MKVILYMAISADGFIAKINGDSDWVSEADADTFENKIKEAGVFIVGRKTFDQYYNDLYPIKDVLNVVLTTNKNRKSENKNILFTTKNPQEIISL